MRGAVQAVLCLLGVSLVTAQEQTAEYAPTNQVVSPPKEHLTLSLPRAGAEVISPLTPAVQQALTMEVGSAGELLHKSADVAGEGSPVENGDPGITEPLGSLEFMHESKVVSATGVSARGPLVQLFDAAKPVDVPKRFLHLLNPFAPLEASPVTPMAPGEHGRAWTALVGWNPGASAFPDPRTHQPTLNLMSIFSAP